MKMSGDHFSLCNMYGDENWNVDDDDDAKV